VLSGAALALAFPKFGHPALAWIALVPWLLALDGAAGRRPGPGRGLLLGLAMGAVYFAGALYWIPDVMVTFGGLARWTAVPVAALLIAYLALFPAAASWIVARVGRGRAPQALWAAPLAWVGTEWLRGWLFSGFPWTPLGSSQVAWLPVAQAASLFGVWGLSAWIVAANVALVVAVRRGRGGVRAALMLAAVSAALAGWGTWRLARADAPPEGPRLRVGVVQGNVPQEQKWSPASAPAILERYLRLSREAAARGARLIVWPESATPFLFEEDPVGGDAVRALARETGAWLLLGSDQIERGSPPRYYNAAFVVAPDGRTVGVYRKRHLVPFGEYVPLKRLLFFVSPLVDAVSDFSPGAEAVMLPIDGHHVSTAICYEIVFGEEVREAVERGSRLLSTITNDAWYGATSAPWQHFDQAVLRTIELRRYLVRAANTGVSGVVDAHGRVLAEQGLFVTGVLVQDVVMLEDRTLYSRIGDSLAWACAAMCVVLLWRTRGRQW
jgi:apolipoprotein N-acyltransferase